MSGVRIFGAFNTGRLYTASGQRIAWTPIAPGYVAMYDLDRMIDYVLCVPGIPDDRSVLRAYDTHGSYLGLDAAGRDIRQNNVAPWDAQLYDAARKLEPQLIAAARLVAPLAVRSH